jgi:hypothetical protein
MHASNKIFLFIKCQIRISLGKEIQGKPCLEDLEWSSTEVSDQLKSWFRSLFIVRKAGSRIIHALEVEVCLWINNEDTRTLCMPVIPERNHSWWQRRNIDKILCDNYDIFSPCSKLTCCWSFINIKQLKSMNLHSGGGWGRFSQWFALKEWLGSKIKIC